MKKTNFLVTLLTVIALTCACLFAACDVHTHTYSKDWSHDDTKHWHAATCEHTDLRKDEADHVWTLVDGSTTDYACICGATKTEQPAHEHTYSEDWSHDENKHWYAATCEHTDLRKDEADHVWTLVDGSTADYACICGATKTEQPAHEHSYSEDWSRDENKHWHAATCEHTDLRKDEADHVWTLDGTQKGVYKCVCGAVKSRLEAEDCSFAGNIRKETGVGTGCAATYFYKHSSQTQLVFRFVSDKATDNVVLGLSIANQQDRLYDTCKEHDLADYDMLTVNGVSYTINGNLVPREEGGDWHDYHDYFATVSIKEGLNEVALTYDNAWDETALRLAIDYIEVYADVTVGTIYEAEAATDKNAELEENNFAHASGNYHVQLKNSDNYVVWEVESEEDREANVVLYLATRAQSNWNEAFDLDLSTQNVFYIVDAEGNKTLIGLEGTLIDSTWLDFTSIKATVNLKAGTNYLRLEVDSVRADGTTQQVLLQVDCIVVY